MEPIKTEHTHTHSISGLIWNYIETKLHLKNNCYSVHITAATAKIQCEELINCNMRSEPRGVRTYLRKCSAPAAQPCSA